MNASSAPQMSIMVSTERAKNSRKILSGINERINLVKQKILEISNIFEDISQKPYIINRNIQ